MTFTIADMFEKAAVSQLPEMAARMWPDSLKVLRDTLTSDGGGGQRASTDTIFDYEADTVPCCCNPVRRNLPAAIVADRMSSEAEYQVVIPVYYNQTRIDILPLDVLEIQARGQEPVKVMRIVSLESYSGVSWAAMCQLRNEETNE